MKTKTISQILSIFQDHITIDQINDDPEISELYNTLLQKREAWGTYSLYEPQGRTLALIEKHCPQILGEQLPQTN
jgi:hypothetical protein